MRAFLSFALALLLLPPLGCGKATDDVSASDELEVEVGGGKADGQMYPLGLFVRQGPATQGAAGIDLLDLRPDETYYRHDLSPGSPADSIGKFKFSQTRSGATYLRFLDHQGKLLTKLRYQLQGEVLHLFGTDAASGYDLVLEKTVTPAWVERVKATLDSGDVHWQKVVDPQQVPAAVRLQYQWMTTGENEHMADWVGFADFTVEEKLVHLVGLYADEGVWLYLFAANQKLIAHANAPSSSEPLEWTTY